jgi:transposase
LKIRPPRRGAGVVRPVSDPRLIKAIGEEEVGLVGVEQWTEIRRMHRVDVLSGREISWRTGLHRDTVARLLAAPAPPRYQRKSAGSKLDPFKDWICEQLASDPRIQSQRLREMAAEIGYEGGRSIFDEFVRDARPRFLVPRTCQRTIYRPGELVQCDLWSRGS